MCIRDSPDITGKPAESLCCAELHALYWSVLGAIAFAILTRPDIAVFVTALQRHQQAPKVIHVKRLNAVVRWAQRNPKAIEFKPLDDLKRPAGTVVPSHLRMYGDAAFKKEEDDGHSMRGALFIRCPGNTQRDFTISKAGHLVDYEAGRQRRVVRATFSAELLNGCDVQDRGFLVAQTFHEMITGESTADAARRLRDRGGYNIPKVLYLDALSVFYASKATIVKTTAECGVLCHLLWLRELLDFGVLEALAWCDTRDMQADGMTKGAVDRELLHLLMSGQVRVSHEMKLWKPKKLKVDPELV